MRSHKLFLQPMQRAGLWLFGVILALTWSQQTASAAEPAPQRLRVLCYNIYHGEGADGQLNLPRLAEVIRSARPDLVALQEVDWKTKRSQQVDQTAELARLTGLHGYFGKQIDFEGGEYGQALLSRVPLTKFQIHWLPGEPPRQQRIAVSAEGTFEEQKVLFVTTHLHHQNEGFRVRQAEKLNEIFAKADVPVILAGDLNALPDSRPLQTLTTHWKLATSASDLFTFPAADPTRQIDYILFRPAGQFRVTQQKVVSEAVASDHRPLLVELEFQSVRPE